MKRIRRQTSTLRSVLAALVLVFFAGGALAHSPYFAEKRPIRFSDGRTGEIRVLNGDGIIAADPSTLLILDDARQVVALSPELRSLSLVCDVKRIWCWGYDHDSGAVWEPDQDAFRLPAKPSPDPDGDIYVFTNALGEQRGFRTRMATPSERFTGERSLIGDSPGAIILLAMTGASALAAGAALLRFPKPWNWGSAGRWIGALLLRFAGTGLALILSLYLLVSRDISEPVWWFGLALGATLYLAWKAIARLRRSADIVRA